MPTSTTADAERLCAEIARLGPWHHDVEVAGGIRTGEQGSGHASAELGRVSLIRPDRILPLMLGELYPNGLEGRSVLDCACNAGGYLFAAATLGAGRGFGFDVRDHWIRQARFLRDHRGVPNVDFATCDLMKLPELHLGTFDVTLFMGLLYHLPDPIAGLQIAANHTKELLIVHTAAAKPERRDGLVLNRESDTDVMSGVHRLAWLPTSPRVIQEMLEWCGFPESRVQFDRQAEDGRRIGVVAARDRSVLAAFDRNRANTGAKDSRWWRRWR